MADDDGYMTSGAVKEFFGGISDMWLWRRANGASDFPNPIRIGGRKFYKRSEIKAWAEAQAQDAA